MNERKKPIRIVSSFCLVIWCCFNISKWCFQISWRSYFRDKEKTDQRPVEDWMGVAILYHIELQKK